MKYVASGTVVNKKFSELKPDDVCRIEYGTYGNYVFAIIDKNASYRDPKSYYEWHTEWRNLYEYLNNPNCKPHLGYEDIGAMDEPTYEVVGKVVNE